MYINILFKFKAYFIYIFLFCNQNYYNIIFFICFVLISIGYLVRASYVYYLLSNNLSLKSIVALSELLKCLEVIYRIQIVFLN